MKHKLYFREKLFFLFSGAVISTPFPFLADSLLNYFLAINLTNYWATLISAVIAAPILEEFAKAYPLFYRHGETQRSLFVLGLYTGLGFAISEFLFYIFFFHAPILVRIPALLFHATNTSIVAFGIGKKQIFRFYSIAVFLHAFNNFFALYSNLFAYGSLIAILISYSLSRKYFYETSEKNI